MTIAGNTIGEAPSAASFCANIAAWRAGRVTTIPRRASCPRPATPSIVIDEPARTVRKKLACERAPHLLGRFDVDDLCFAFGPHHFASVTARDQPTQPQRAFLPGTVRRERRVTASRKRTREGTLGVRREPRCRVVQRREGCQDVRT